MFFFYCYFLDVLKYLTRVLNVCALNAFAN